MDPKLEKVYSKKLPFRISHWIAFSNDGVILEKENGNKLLKLKLETEPTLNYSTQWIEHRPKGVKHESRKYILNNERVLMRYWEDNRTYVFNPSLKLLKVFNGEYGRLCGTISPDLMLYGKRLNEKSYQIDIYRESDHKYIKGLSKSLRSQWISVCQNDSTDQIAIVDSDGQTLDIYDEDFCHQKRVELDFEPQGLNAICHVQDFIMVAGQRENKLFVFSWEGRLVKEVDVEGMLCGIGAGAEGQVQLVTHTDIHVYNVQ